ncbi:cobyrinate a,c-diamide synthase [Propionibacterium sp.]|uniref:cobyrinate a,c-diamide synthase n=1 Tax=Propionibacterium sp. TaxID=1977903 RepID=UPI0039EB3666
MSTRIPRLVVAAPSSGQGKTTVAIGLMAALSARGHIVAGFKVGPDYIDPGYHALACGRPGRNLDPYLCGEERIAPLFLHGATEPAPAEIAVVEGVMGLFDGKLGAWPDGSQDLAGFGSTAHVARLLEAPVVVVVDASHGSRTAAAVCHGLASYDSRIRVAGVVVNRVMSPLVADEITRGCDQVGLPVLGVIPIDKAVSVGSRHLGLITADESEDAAQVVRSAGELIAAHVDLDAVRSLAAQAPGQQVDPWDPTAEVHPVGQGAVIAMAAGPAFTFRYTETEELLRATGARVESFDPLGDAHLPAETAGLYLGGGFPEEHAEALAGNTSLREEIGRRCAEGMPTIAECAGLLYLCRSLDGLAMAGAVDLDARMSPQLTIGYHEAHAAEASFLFHKGEVVRAHEFHRTITEAAPGLSDEAQGVLEPAWQIGECDEGVVLTFPGVSSPGTPATLVASYQHTHWASSPVLAERFAQAAADFAVGQAAVSHRAITKRLTTGDAVKSSGLPAAVDLRHHGDQDIESGLVDLAVNVHAERPPQWLVGELTHRANTWGRYPDATVARDAVAARHGVNPDQVLLTAGASEAFWLLARAVTPRWAVVVHPQFTEPEVALRTAGHRVGRLILRPEQGFRFDPVMVDSRADLVMIGNPTNPTSVLHPAESIRSMLRSERIVVVDEAFMDAVPGEPESLIGGSMEGLLVVRSLTKTWSIPGIRAGYAVGDARVVAQLTAQQPAWPVASPALDAIELCCSPEAQAETAQQARQIVEDRDDFTESLTRSGIRIVNSPRAPFVLADLRDAEPAMLRERLHSAGFSVRGCESFPGLGPSWLRLAVRSRGTSMAFAQALAMALSSSAGRPHP